MNLKKIFEPRAVVIILICSILFGFLANILLDWIDRLIYPEEYYETVMKYSEEYSVPSELIFAVIKVESDFEPDAKSHAGAIGLMQMIPNTYEWLAKDKLGEFAITPMLYDPETNIKYGTYYLRYLHSKFNSWELAIIAYNWGEGNLSNFLDEYGYEEGDYDSIPVKETRNYIKKVMHHWDKYNELY